MKIYKKQAGGVIYTPLNVNMASTQAGTTQTTTSKSSENDQIQKALIDVLKERGLQNDVDYFLRQANRLMTSNTISLFGADESYDMADLIKLHSLANRIKLNKDSFDKAVENISEENAGSDVAITNTGGLYVQDANGKIKIISAANYHDNSEDYTLLTNRDLLQLRQYQSGLEYNSNILNDLGNTIGMKSIVEYMKSTIKDFGKMEYEDSMDSYTIKHKGQIQKGMESILGGAAPDGIYKVSVTNKSTDQGYEDEKSLFAAAEYLWSTLNGNMKNTIRAHTAAEGLDPTKAKDVYRILISAIQEHTTHSRSRDVDVEYDASASKAVGMGSGTSEQTTQLTYLEEVANGRATLPQRIDLRNNTSMSNISFIGNPYQVLDHTEKPVKTESITNMLLDAQVGQIVDQSSVSFGNKVLGIHEKSQVLYDSNSQMYRVNLPYDVAYYNSTGKYKPDLDAQAKFDEFVKWVNNNNPSQIMITQKLQELGLNISYDSNDNEWVFNNNKEFIMMTGITSHRAVDISDKWKGKLSNQEASYLYDYLDEHTDYDEALWNIWGDASSTYKSAIFMPIIDSALATVGTSGEYVPKTYKMDIQNRTRYNNAINNIQTNF